MESHQTHGAPGGYTPHYRPKELCQALAGEWTAEDRRRALDHFGRGCPDCWQALDELARCEDADFPLDVTAGREGTVEPGAPVGRVLELCLALLATPGNHVARRQRFAELRSMEWHALTGACTTRDPDEKALAFRRLVLEESRRLSLRHRSYLVELLRTTVDELRDPWLKKRVPERADSLQALGLAYLADDLRVAGRTGQAREKLWEAKRLLNERPCDPEIYATYCEIEADFACARSDRSKTDSPRNDLSQASNFLALAEKYLRDYPIAERAADTLVRRGLLYMRLGNLASAIEAFGAALRAIPAGADPRLRLDALHHSAVAEVRRGGYAAAKRLLEEAKPLYGRHTLPQILVQRDWLWGLVYLDARLYAEAEEALRTAQRGFQRLGMAGDEAPVLTDLQKLYTLTGNLDALDAVRARLSQLTDRTDPVN